jgi:hypothetical protein
VFYIVTSKRDLFVLIWNSDLRAMGLLQVSEGEGVRFKQLPPLLMPPTGHVGGYNQETQHSGTKWKGAHVLFQINKQTTGLSGFTPKSVPTIVCVQKTKVKCRGGFWLPVQWFGATLGVGLGRLQNYCHHRHERVVVLMIFRCRKISIVNLESKTPQLSCIRLTLVFLHLASG